MLGELKSGNIGLQRVKEAHSVTALITEASSFSGGRLPTDTYAQLQPPKWGHSALWAMISGKQKCL